MRALVIGDAIVDRDVDLIYVKQDPAHPSVPVFRCEETERNGGAIFVAAQLKAVGVHGVGILGLSSLKTRHYRDGHYLNRVDRDVAPLTDESQDELLLWVSEKLRNDAFDVIVLVDYDKGVLTERVCRAVIKMAGDIPVIAGPSDAHDWGKFEGCLGIVCNHAQYQANGYLLPTRHPVVVTHGSHGLLAFEGTETLDEAGYRRHAIDPTGCGDVALAVVAAGIAGGLTWFQAAKLANLYASLEVERQGCVPITLEGSNSVV